MSEDQEILKRRARVLARRQDAEQHRTTTSHVTFAIGGDVFALPAAAVRQILLRALITPLPGAQAPLRGVTAWRGEIINVIDLPGTETPIAEDGDGTVIVMGEERAVAMLIDEVRGLVELAAEDIHSMNKQDARPYARGVTRDATVVLTVAELIDTLG